MISFISLESSLLLSPPVTNVMQHIERGDFATNRFFEKQMKSWLIYTYKILINALLNFCKWYVSKADKIMKVKFQFFPAKSSLLIFHKVSSHKQIGAWVINVCEVNKALSERLKGGSTKHGGGKTCELLCNKPTYNVLYSVITPQ